jgi:hypothetical protein
VHQKPVADGDGGYRHFLDAALGNAMGLARRAVDQRAQITLGAGNRDFLEHVAAGIHQRHDGPGQRLAERDRGTHRYQRDRIDAEPPAQQIAGHRNRQSRDHRQGCQRPAEIGDCWPAGERGDESGRQSCDRDRDQRPSHDALK